MEKIKIVNGAKSESTQITKALICSTPVVNY